VALPSAGAKAGKPVPQPIIKDTNMPRRVALSHTSNEGLEDGIGTAEEENHMGLPITQRMKDDKSTGSWVRWFYNFGYVW
jgi:hypothetical protein